jgi:hypothetical protein
MAVDFNFLFDGFYYRLHPNNPAAEDAWRQIAAHFEAGAIDIQAWPSVKRQLQVAGYVVRRYNRKHLIDTDELLEALSK